MTDGQTDRQTELPWHIRAIATLSRVKTCDTIFFNIRVTDMEFSAERRRKRSDCIRVYLALAMGFLVQIYNEVRSGVARVLRYGGHMGSGGRKFSGVHGHSPGGGLGRSGDAETSSN